MPRDRPRPGWTREPTEPALSHPLTLKVQEKDVWKVLQHVTSLDQLRSFAGLPWVASAIEGASLDRVLTVIEAARSAEQGQVERPLRTAEYERLTHAPTEIPGVLAPQGVKFAAFEIPDDRADLPPNIARLVIVPELREVRVQISFSRFAALSANLQGEYDFTRYKVHPAVLTLPTGNEKWLPAAEVREPAVRELDDVADINAAADVKAILRAALLADPQRRIAHMSTFCAALRAALAVHGVPPDRPTQAQAPLSLDPAITEPTPPEHYAALASIAGHLAVNLWYLAGLSLDSGWLVIFDRRSNTPRLADRTASSAADSPGGRRITVIRA